MTAEYQLKSRKNWINIFLSNLSFYLIIGVAPIFLVLVSNSIIISYLGAFILLLFWFFREDFKYVFLLYKKHKELKNNVERQVETNKLLDLHNKKFQNDIVFIFKDNKIQLAKKNLVSLEKYPISEQIIEVGNDTNVLFSKFDDVIEIHKMLLEVDNSKEAEMLAFSLMANSMKDVTIHNQIIRESYRKPFTIGMEVSFLRSLIGLMTQDIYKELFKNMLVNSVKDQTIKTNSTD